MRLEKTRTVKHYAAVWGCIISLLAFLASSCSESSGVATATNNDYCYIKSVTLGTVKRKTGTLNTSFAGSNYLMTVNQRTLTIENRDSLPYGSLLERVIATIAFDGQSLAYREKGTDAWTAYNATDSLDLSKPLELFLTSNDNQTSRLYTLKVNVHQLEGDSLYWKQCETGVAEVGDMTDMKAFVLNDKLMVLGRKEDGIALAERSGTETSGTWQEEVPAGLPASTEIQTLRKSKDALYISSADGKIFTSANAKDWQQVGTTYPAPLSLVEKTDDRYYALSEGKLLTSDDASNWKEEALDTDASMLPTTDIRTLCLPQANGSTRIVMVGQREGDSHAVVWNKLWNDSETEDAAQWIHFPISSDNTIPCPRLAHFNLLPYDNSCIAIGGASADGKHQALDAIYVSRDYGITWRKDLAHNLPAALKGTKDCITCTVDDNYFIWIITNTQIWRGRLERLGFAQQ